MNAQCTVVESGTENNTQLKLKKSLKTNNMRNIVKCFWAAQICSLLMMAIFSTFKAKKYYEEKKLQTFFVG